MFSRLFRSISLSTFSFSSILLSILQFQKSINNIKNRLFITRFKTSYLTMQNLYIKFYDKLKFSSFNIIQNNLHFVFFDMRIRQTRIASYFKSTFNDFTSRFFISTNWKIKLISNKKHVDSKSHDKSIKINDLTSKNSYDNYFIKYFHIYRRFTQHFISNNMFHKHLNHCSENINRWSFVRIFIEKRHFFNCINNVSFSLLTHVE